MHSIFNYLSDVRFEGVCAHVIVSQLRAQRVRMLERLYDAVPRDRRLGNRGDTVRTEPETCTDT